MHLSPEERAVIDRHRPRLGHRWNIDRGRGLIYAVIDHGDEPALGEVLLSNHADSEQALDQACRLARSFSIRAGLLGLASGGAAAVVVADPALDREGCVRLLHERLPSTPVRMLAGAGLHDAAERLGTPVVHDPELLARVRARVLEACLRPVLPQLEGRSAVVLGAEARGRDLAAALHGRGVEVSLWDPSPDLARTTAEALGLRVLDGEWADAEVDVLVPCGEEAVIDAAVAQRLGARVVCGGAPRVFASTDARTTLLERGRWCVPEILAATAEPVALAVATGSLDQTDALAQLDQTATEVLTEPHGAHDRAITLAVQRSKAAQSRPRKA
ncbi:hypothetical protein [Paraliomyxa miuraensis]|uniref:hypothetical protein n=1 Tax=Paraliomyxa miuraensis TaxID=376150 RepID=UPI00225ABE44|nr:hypothetical protein [Paraliomyxa miuraensis]MCX4247701.1 hypothetical protein [Paraliomyxa miuraensis]